MYYAFFGLSQAPFKITPDTDFFFEGGNRGDFLLGTVLRFLPVLTTYWPSEPTLVGNRSMPRGAGPARFSPRIVYINECSRNFGRGRR